jgi:hypothetical protein
MYARVIKFYIDPAQREHAQAALDGIAKNLPGIPGLQYALAVWNDDGTGIYTALYHSKAEAEAALPQIQALWSGIAGYLVKEPEITPYDNAAVLHNSA